MKRASSIPITEAMRQMVLHALRTKGLSKQNLAAVVGNGKAWVTKFLDGSLRSIKEDDMASVEDFLGIRFFQIEQTHGERSPLAMRVAALVDQDESFAKLAMALDEILTKPRPSTTRYIPTEDMTRIGQEIIRIAFANEDKPGKVAREVLRLLA